MHVGGIGEADHRIANSLSMISGLLRLHARDLHRKQEPVSSNDIVLIIEEAISRIEAVAMLHRFLSVEPDRRAVDLDQYLFRVCDAVISSVASDRKIEPIYRLGSGQLVSPQIAVSIGLIVTELLTNSIKYAHPTGIEGKAVIATTLDGDHLAIDVEDDGVGLPVDHDPASDGSLGFRLVRSMATQCGGSVEFQSSEIGLRVRLVVPQAD